MTSVQSMLKVERLTKSYRTAAGGELTVLREVSFDILAGASVAIVGPSGSGKTTLLGVLAGVLQATSGHVHGSCLRTDLRRGVVLLFVDCRIFYRRWCLYRHLLHEHGYWAHLFRDHGYQSGYPKFRHD